MPIFQAKSRSKVPPGKFWVPKIECFEAEL